jgi:opacity protein-like surface antigen
MKMKRILFAFRTLILFVLAFPTINVSAQTLYDRSFRNWDEGPVTWNDFQVRHTPDDAKFVSNLYCSIERDVKREKIGNFKIPVLTTTTRMNKISSWYDPDKSTDWTLRYEQARFDMLEVLRRRMQNSFNRNCMEENLDAYYEQLINSTMTAFDMESNYGTDTLVVLRYEEQYKNELDTMSMEPVQIPVFQKKDWGATLGIGIGFEKYGSPMSKGVTPATGILMDLGFIYKSFIFDFDGLLAWSGPLQSDNFYYDSKYDYTWTKGKKVRAGNININVGYRVLDNPNLSATPLIGIGVSFVDQDTDTLMKNSNTSFESSEISGFRTQAGLAFDWKYRKSLNTYLYGADYTESKIRFAVTGARTNFKVLGPTYSLNASVILIFESWNLK